VTGRDDTRLPVSSIPVPARARTATPAAPARDPFGLRRGATVSNALAAPAPAVVAVAKPADDSTYFAIVPSGVALDAREVESTIPAVEVTVSWGRNDVLSVAHLAPPRAFVVGERAPDGETPDFELEAAFLGLSRWSVVEPGEGSVNVLVPNGATIRVRRDDATVEHDSLLGTFDLRASARLAGGFEYALRVGESASVEMKGFVFTVRSVNAGRKLVAPLRVDRRLVGTVGGVSAFVLAMFGFASLLRGDDSMLTADSLDLGNRYVQAAIQTNERLELAESAASSSGPSSDSAADLSGKSGDPVSPDTQRRSARRGEADPDTATLVSPSSSDQIARDNVVIDAVATIATLFSNGPTSSFAANDAIGADAIDALGALVGARIGSSGGLGGLGPMGSGLGGGGDGHGTYGPGDRDGSGPHDGTGFHTSGNVGECRGDDCGMGERIGHPGPSIRFTPPTPGPGGLTADQIRRVIQRNVPQVEHCYEQGLQANPTLQGRVTVGFVISPTGAVMTSNADNSIGSANVSACISGAVRRWSFPATSDGRPVSVRFPFNLHQAQ